MSVRVLVADDDLDVHEFLRDVLEISFDDVEIDKALDQEAFRRSIKDADPPYNLILLDYGLDGPDGTRVIELLNGEFSRLRDRTVFLDGLREEMDTDERVKGIPIIRKPFSLDTFGDIVKKACVTC